MTAMMQRLDEAVNAHDLDSFVACFAPDYASDQPAHPARAFRGRDQVRKNWSAVFAGIADLTSELLLSGRPDGADDVEFGEFSWKGTYGDGSPFAMRGAVVMGVEDDQIVWGRLYMEIVEEQGADIDQMVQQTYRPPSS
ncbi:MAG: nuclear transport factor 2 family protein [Mycobacteriales bacterium]